VGDSAEDKMLPSLEKTTYFEMEIKKQNKETLLQTHFG
jgi:hypothetical protein